jgi:hypothetical protein
MRQAFLLLALLAAGPARGENLFTIDPPPPSIPVALRPVLTGLERPTSITHAGDANAGDDRLFLTLQEGLVVFLDGKALHPEPFLDIRSLMTPPKPQAHGGEQGLLGLAFHPRYDENGLFFVCYTDRNGAVTVARYRVSDDPGRADPASSRILLSLSKKHPNHNGGQIQFGPDGYLYIAVGDGGAEGDPECLAQKESSLFGKILRIDVDVDLDAGAALPPYYGIPPTNPFPGREIWVSGLRNPWRFSFDRATGDLWIADVGTSRREEIDILPAGAPGGRNYGWKLLEGSSCFSNVACPVGTPLCDSPLYTPPDLEYAHGTGECSITGGYVSRAPSLPHAWGVYFFGDLCSGRLWAAQRHDGAWTVRQLPEKAPSVVTFGEDRAGNLWLATYSGTLYQLAPQHPVDTPGLYAPAQARYLFKDLWMDGPEDRTLRFGRANRGWLPLAGDWDGDGRTTIGSWDPAGRIFRLKNALGPGGADLLWTITPPSDRALPVAGDWDGDGRDSVGFYDPLTSTFHLTNRQSAGTFEIVFAFGQGGLPVAGDWDGDGGDSVGLYVPGRGVFLLRNELSAGSPALRLRFGAGHSNALPVAGDWDGDGRDTVGLYDPATATFRLDGPTGRTVRFGTPGAAQIPMAGEW